MWSQVIKQTHNLDCKPLGMYAKKTLPDIWSNIVKVRDDLDGLDLEFDKLFSYVVGSGENTLFWQDKLFSYVVGSGEEHLRFFLLESTGKPFY